MKTIGLFLFLFIQHAFAQMDTLLQFHPMQTGNIWVYRSSIGGNTSAAIKTVIGDSLIEDHVYKKIEWTNTLNAEKKIVLQRVDSAVGTLLERSGTEDFMIDSLAAVSHISFGTFSSHQCESTGLDTIFGSSVQTRTILYKILPMVPRTKYALGIGEVYSSSQVEDPSLPIYYTVENSIVYAKVNGKEYGTNPLSVKNNESDLPMSFSLRQNYPNPFNPVTIIEYQLAHDEIAKLIIVDMLGREVISLVNGVEKAGKHSITFNASHLPSGVYFYQLHSGIHSETKKMILLK